MVCCEHMGRSCVKPISSIHSNRVSSATQCGKQGKGEELQLP
jgi:hypothetical protein